MLIASTRWFACFTPHYCWSTKTTDNLLNPGHRSIGNIIAGFSQCDQFYQNRETPLHFNVPISEFCVLDSWNIVHPEALLVVKCIRTFRYCGHFSIHVPTSTSLNIQTWFSYFILHILKLILYWSSYLIEVSLLRTPNPI